MGGLLLSLLLLLPLVLSQQTQQSQQSQQQQQQQQLQLQQQQQLQLDPQIITPPPEEESTALPSSDRPNYFAGNLMLQCVSCPIPPTPRECGKTNVTAHCRTPYSAPFMGQNHVSTCARLKCPPNYDLYLNTALLGEEGDNFVQFPMKRPTINPQTVVCMKSLDSGYQFMVRDVLGYMRPVHDAQCRLNNFPRHSCISDGFIMQTCTTDVKCRPMKFVSDYGGALCDAPYKLHMRFLEDKFWTPLSKVDCDQHLGWWRLHFPNGTYMHTIRGTVGTCVHIPKINKEWQRVLAGRCAGGLVVAALTIALTFNAYMCRSVVVWEGSNWHRTIWNQDLSEGVVNFARDRDQDDIIRNTMQTQNWDDMYADGLSLDMRQYDVMLRADTSTGYAHEMGPWTMIDDFDYFNQREEESEA